MDKFIGLILIVAIGTLMLSRTAGQAEELYQIPEIREEITEEKPEEIPEIVEVEEEIPETTCHEKVMEYIEEDNAPFLIDTTAYCHGTICSHGDKPREGIVAAAPEWYGMACVIYEAVPTGDGYKCGDFIGIYEIKDTGYGKSSNNGIPSKIRSDKEHQGTIEIGKCIDKYSYTYAEAKEWMRLTGGKVFIQLMSGEG